MLPELPAEVRILVIDDMESNVLLLQSVFGRAGCSNVVGCTDAREALTDIRAARPDLVILDLHMPYLTGIEVLDTLQGDPERDPYLPVLVLTGDASDTARHEALGKGASDFLTKPFDAVEAVLRARNLLETRRLHLMQRDQNAILEERVRERTRDLELAQLEILDRLALAGDFRDDVTGAHARRVGSMAGMVAEALGLPDGQRDLLQLAAPLHDIGKIGTQDAVLLKPGKLTPEEFEHIKTHVHTGAQLLSGSRFPILQLGREIALMHHERWDGTGYLGVAGDNIPIAARVVSVADVFDALTHVRPYKQAWPIDQALLEIERLRGRAFDPSVVDAFMTLGVERWTTARLDALGTAPRQFRPAA